MIKYLKNKFVKDVLWSSGSTVLMGVCGIFINILIGGKYGPTNLGIFNQALSVYLIASIFSVWGIHVSIVKHSAEKKSINESNGSLLSSALANVIVISGTISFFLILFSEKLSLLFNSPTLEYSLRNFMIGIPLFSLNKVYMAFLNGKRQMKKFAIIQSFRWINITLIITIISILNLEIENLALAFPLTEFIILIFFLIHIKVRFYSVTFKWVRRHFIFGTKSFFSSVIVQINTNMDILMLGYFSSDHDVGLYSIAITVIRGLLGFSGIIQLNFNPVISKLWTENRIDDLKFYIKKLKKYSVIIYTPILILAFLVYPALINNIQSLSEFSFSIYPFYILLVGFFFISIYGYLGGILVQTGLPGIQLKRSIIALVFNFVANLIFIPIWGVQGAATATSLSFFLSIYMLKYYSNKHLSLKLK